MARFLSIAIRRSTWLCCAVVGLLVCVDVAAAQTPRTPRSESIRRAAAAAVLPKETYRSAETPRRLTTVAPPELRTPFADSPFAGPEVEYLRSDAVDEFLDWTPQLLPEGLIYRSYLAGAKESRMATTFNYQTNGDGGLWDITLGGRFGLFRFGSMNGLRPEGFQIDVEGSGQPRLDLSDNEDLIAADFRAGLPITYGIGPWQMKFAYYHLSSHVGDEYLVTHPGFQRRNYVRDELVLGQSLFVTEALRLYGEVGWAFYSDVAEPWEFQFGADYSPLNPPGLYHSAPFFAVNGHLRQELNFGGNFVAQAGRQWRGGAGGQLLRIGLEYYNGQSNQFEFYDQFEQKIGIGIWYDY